MLFDSMESKLKGGAAGWLIRAVAWWTGASRGVGFPHPDVALRGSIVADYRNLFGDRVSIGGVVASAAMQFANRWGGRGSAKEVPAKADDKSGAGNEGRWTAAAGGVRESGGRGFRTPRLAVVIEEGAWTEGRDV